MTKIDTKIMLNKYFFEKVFSSERMKRYFDAHKSEEKAMLHYRCNIELSKAFYTCLSISEVALRNALNRELIAWAGRDDWYTVLAHKPELHKLDRYVKQAIDRSVKGNHAGSSSDVISELTLGFWVTLFNSEYEKILWKDLRKAFPYMPKKQKQRRNISAPLNRFRSFRNRIFHHEPICWDLEYISKLNSEIMEIAGWINRDIPTLILSMENVCSTIEAIREKMDWR